MRPLASVALTLVLAGCGGAEVGETTEPAPGADPAPVTTEGAPHPAQSVGRTAVDRPTTEAGALAVRIDGERVMVSDAIVIRRPDAPPELLLFEGHADCAVVRETPFQRDDVMARVTLPNDALAGDMERTVTLTAPLDDDRVQLEDSLVARVCDLEPL